ncbi:MAG: hypothetical protein LBU27_02980 [Candidatus Peribacteria bacterium]|jgi:peptidoglycan hydrolase-like protein with peptidoglycan-binding domain|nr:hypothetical protein [Candidatus Peribacteria bacterium]
MLNITQAVTTNSKQLERFAVVSGKTASEFAKLFKEDASKAFDLFVHGLKNSGDDAIGILQELKLKNSNTINALLSLANNADILTQALDMANKARDENNALQIEADKRFNSTSSQIQIQQNRRAAFGASF